MDKANFGPISQHNSLQALALEQIRDAILEGKLSPGTPLRINTLAADLGVSPIPVREALQVLVTEGLAIHQPRRGMIVRPLTADDVAGTYQVMSALEGLAASHVAGRLPAAVIADLRQRVVAMQEAIERGDHEALLQMDRQFHAIICDAYPNNWARQFLRQIWNCTYRIRRVYPRSDERLRETTAEHHALVDALEGGDAALSETLARRHIDGARDDLLRRLQAAEQANASA